MIPWYVVSAAGVLAAAWALPAEPFAPADPSGTVVYVAVTGGTVAAIVAGIRHRRPATSRAWWAIAAGQSVHLAAGLASYALHAGGAHPSFPTTADYLHVVHFPFFGYGLLALVRDRDRGRNPGAALDAAIVATSAGLLASTFLLDPHALGGTTETTVFSAVFGVEFVVVLGLAVRLLISRGPRDPSHLLLAASALSLSMAETLSAALLHGRVHEPGVAIELMWLGGHALLAAAVLHPSASRAAAPELDEERAGFGRLTMLAGGALIAPAVHAMSHFGGWHVDEVAVVAAGALAFVLVVVRLGLVLRRQEKVIADHRAAQRQLRLQQEELARSEQERGRLLERTMEVAEAERTRVAVEIHDGPIQRLAALGFLLDRGQRAVQRGQVADGLALYDKARGVVGEEVGSLRRLMAGLRPPSLDHKGLEAALNDALDRFARDSGTTVAFRSDLAGNRLHPDTETVLYRVAQEALTNVAKHAEAKTVRVEITSADDLVRMTVADDGRGFDPERATDLSGEHFGLAAMRERVVRAGGEWRIRTLPDTGTAVVVEMPAQRVPL